MLVSSTGGTGVAQAKLTKKAPPARAFHRQQDALLALAAQLLPPSSPSGGPKGAASLPAGTTASPQLLQARLQEVLEALQARLSSPGSGLDSSCEQGSLNSREQPKRR